MKLPDPRLEPEWDEDNLVHIARHGIAPEQVEEVYYSEGPLPTLAGQSRRQRRANRRKELRYRLWGTDAAGEYLEVIVAPYAKYGVWRCVTAHRMTPSSRKAYLGRVRKVRK